MLVQVTRVPALIASDEGLKPPPLTDMLAEPVALQLGSGVGLGEGLALGDGLGLGETPEVCAQPEPTVPTKRRAQLTASHHFRGRRLSGLFLAED